MANPTSPDMEREQQFNRVLLPLVQALEKGQALDREQVLAAHPEFAAELAEFFAGHDCLRGLAIPSPRAIPIPEPTAELGQLGDFRLLREVGRGGMGIVYEAEQISLHRHVALKVLPFAAALDPRQLQRFKNEAQAAALLHHPHIVPIYSVGYERGVHYYSMQFIDGPSLASLLQGLRRGSSPPPSARRSASTSPTDDTHWPGSRPAARGSAETSPRAANTTERSPRGADYFRRMAQLALTAAGALEHAHQLGVIHRDIKPANLLLDRRGNLWITDFGLALLHNQAGLTTTGELVGTLRYMSPEQAGAQRGLVDQRTDVYSLGVTLYELLTLKPLFEGEDPRRLLQQIASEEPRLPRDMDRAIPVELELIVLKAIAKSPAERYTSAQDFADDLQRFLNDQPVRARRPTLLDLAVKWSRRHRALVASGLIVLVLTTLGLLVSTVLIAGAHRAARTAYQHERQKADEAEQQRARAEANFVQARRAVDLLTQVSTEELVDRPELLEVRQKLLEGALQYYQQFIDQHQGDPSTRAELAASRGHVAQILRALSAQREYMRLMLLGMLLAERTVRDDLNATLSQDREIEELSRRLMGQNRLVLRNSAHLADEERAQKFQELAAANEKAVGAILQPAQLRRLKQIALQEHGPQAFSEPEVADALQLTAEQKVGIRRLQEEFQRALRDIARPETPPDEANEQARHMADSTRERILAGLTSRQRAAWKELTGEPFRGRICFLPQLGFGPPEGGRPEPPPPPPEGRPPGLRPPDFFPGPGGRPADGPPG